MRDISSSSSADAIENLVVIALACTGGYADAASFLLAGTFTGHVTGNVILAAISLGTGKYRELGIHLLAIGLFSFATGAGVLLSRAFANTAAALMRALCIEMTLVAFAMLCTLEHISRTSIPLIACLCLALGLQNGVFSKSLGVSVHATYLTGNATRLLTSILQKEPSDAQMRSERNTAIRLLWLTSISFAAGAVFAGFAVHLFEGRALWLLELILLLTTLAAWNAEANAPRSREA
jgi:uncharacterized membrane protein YoaK (UPF0700 family)